ncbi:undecaprenyl-diphosphate phosphatase [Caldisericum exile]|uniref:Undecaprenyl-diphosphatase n=1 Tax=Caldisericum exile (strain DSM 21853 / NBRC 104410 / AZM16c01) TaxID=511051 RepID=A0A7U6GEP2_CALEA|nr:undecaprenyl-diphosphate phosphatase [Caldisericum exile]BAL80999.1 undecaprenyl-diphosphatase [Caldisericum exile AZM16c01]
MNGLKEAVILGIIQGATEFLPVSSSGHLVVIPALFHLQMPNLPFTMGLHAGTLLALIVYFYREVLGLFKGFFAIFKVKRNSEEEFYLKLLLMIVVAVIPAGIAGVLLSKKVDQLFSNPKAVSYMFLITGIFLVISSVFSDKARKSIKEMGITDALIVGIFQIFALPPGVSRSGSTITGGIISELNRESASKFSFLVAIPVILGAALLEVRSSSLIGFTFKDLAVGFIVSFIVGLLSLLAFFPLIKKTKFYVFAVYCFVIGIIGIFIFK